MGDKRIIVHEVISAGQLRPYDDHIYESFLTFSVPDGQVWASKWPKSAEQVEPFARLLVCNWVDGEREWHQPKLEKLERVPGDTNKWHVIVTSPYLD